MGRRQEIEEFDLHPRGARVDDALARLDRIISYARGGGPSIFAVVTGYGSSGGTAMIKNAVIDACRRYRRQHHIRGYLDGEFCNKFICNFKDFIKKQPYRNYYVLRAERYRARFAGRRIAAVNFSPHNVVFEQTSYLDLYLFRGKFADFKVESPFNVVGDHSVYRISAHIDGDAGYNAVQRHRSHTRSSAAEIYQKARCGLGYRRTDTESGKQRAST